MGMNTMNVCGMAARTLAIGSVFVGIVVSLPQPAQAQYGQNRQYGNYGRGDGGQGGYGRGRRTRQQDTAYTYGRINFNYDLNGLNLRDRGDIERQIRQDLNANPGSQRVGRNTDSQGTLDVKVTLRRVNRDTIQSDVRIGLNQDGRGGSAVTATESATTQSRDRNVDGSFVLEAFRKARREFTGKVNQYARDTGNGNDRAYRGARGNRNNF